MIVNNERHELIDKPKAIAVFGASGSGKDTVAKMLCMLDDRFHHMRFADPAKRQLERTNGLPYGLIEHRCVKAKGWLDRLIIAYHARQHESEVPTETISDLQALTEYNLIPVFTDCRNRREHLLLQSYEVIGVWLESAMGKTLSTDTFQYSYWGLCPEKYVIFNNDRLVDLIEETELFYKVKVKQQWSL